MNLAFVGMAAALGLSASGSAFGAGFAGQAAVGAWKKCYASGKPAPFIMIAFAGAPLTQTIYGFLLMNFIKSAVEGGADAGLALGVGIFCGLAIGLSALFQGKCAAGASDALGATGKGTANYFIVVGIVEYSSPLHIGIWLTALRLIKNRIQKNLTEQQLLFRFFLSAYDKADEFCGSV